VKQMLALVLCLGLSACGAGKSSPTTLQLDKLQGQWVVINYWAKWCKPCVAEIPELNRLDQEYQQITVLGVNYDGTTGDELQQELIELGVAFPTLATDPAEQLGVPRPRVLPTTLVIDPDGKLRETLLGPQTVETLTQATSQASKPVTASQQ
jgi:thiol-disulfide isomerase/thioredoxin